MQENKWIYFLKQHWKKGLYLFLFALLAVVWTENRKTRSAQGTTQDFFAMHQLLSSFKKGHLIPIESLEKAENLLKRHPELHPSYDGMLASCFFAAHQSTEAAVYAQWAEKRLVGLVPSYFSDFAAATSQIALANYPLAYQLAVDLENKLCTSDLFPHLRSLNLLRLYFLSTVADSAHETEQWSERLQKHPNFPEIASLFQKGQFSFEQFLKEIAT